MTELFDVETCGLFGLFAIWWSSRPLDLAVRWLLFIEHFLEFRVDWQALEHTDIGSTGVSSWNYANGRAERAQNDTSGLPQDFAYSTTSNANSKHEPMSLNVRDDVTLPKDMGTFQMLERLVQAATLQETSGLRNLSAESLFQNSVHESNA